MKSFSFKKLLALILVVMMTITSLPLNAFAHDHEANSENGTLDGVESKPFEETVLLKQIKQDIADLLNKYLGTTVMSEEQVKAAVSAMGFGQNYLRLPLTPMEENNKERMLAEMKKQGISI